MVLPNKFEKESKLTFSYNSFQLILHFIQYIALWYFKQYISEINYN